MWLSMLLKPGHTGKKISGDWRLLRCGCGGGWKKVSWRDMKTNEEVPQLVQEKKKPYGCDLEKEHWIGHILRGESLLKEVIEGRMIGKRPMGRNRLGMLNEFLKEASYAELKRKAENRK